MQELEKILEEIEGEENKVLSRLQVEVSQRSIDEIREYVNGIRYAKDIIRKYMNDGWISVDDNLPEDDVDVLITYTDIDDENYTDICITTYGYAYLGGNKLDFKEWRSPFEYFKTNYKVIAWRPLPEPYRTERSEE